MNNQIYIPVSPFGPDRWSDVPMCDGDGVGKDFPVCSFSIGWEWGRDCEQSGQSGPVIRTQINKAETDNIWKPVTSSDIQWGAAQALLSHGVEFDIRYLRDRWSFADTFSEPGACLPEMIRSFSLFKNLLRILNKNFRDYYDKVEV